MLDLMTSQEEDLAYEKELLVRTGEGDRDAFNELYERFSGVLYSTAYKVLNNQDDAQDVLQDVFVQIWEKASMYDGSRGKPLTWAMTMTRNKAIDRLRSKQRRSKLNDDAERESNVHKEEFQTDALEEVCGMERGEVVRNAVLQLSREQRQAIEMAFFGGLTQNEIADALSEPLGTIKARIRRGMMKLKTIIEPRL